MSLSIFGKNKKNTRGKTAVDDTKAGIIADMERKVILEARKHHALSNAQHGVGTIAGGVVCRE